MKRLALTFVQLGDEQAAQLLVSELRQSRVNICFLLVSRAPGSAFLYALACREHAGEKEDVESDEKKKEKRSIQLVHVDHQLQDCGKDNIGNLQG